MSIIATAVKHLLAAGVTGDALVAAIADMEANMPLGAQAPERSKAALRTERWRERKADEASQSVTERHAVTENVTDVTSGSLPLSSPQTPHQTPTPPDTKPAHVRGTRLSADWQPKTLESGKAAEIVLLRGVDWTALELEKFRNYWLAKPGKDGRSVEWQRTWAKWIIQANEYRPAQARSQSAAGPQSDLQALLEQSKRFQRTPDMTGQAA